MIAFIVRDVVLLLNFVILVSMRTLLGRLICTSTVINHRDYKNSCNKSLFST